MRPVTTVPRPEIENTSSIGIRNGWSIGRSGSGTKVSSASYSLRIASSASLALLAVERLDRRAADHRRLVAGELVLGQKLAHLELDQIEQLGIVHHVDLVEEHHDVGHAHLARQQDVLARLRHRTVRRRHHQDRAVHLRRAGDHVLDVVGMARAVDMRVVALRRSNIPRGSSQSSKSWSGRAGPGSPTPSPPDHRTRSSSSSPCPPTPWSAPPSASSCRGPRDRSSPRCNAASLRSNFCLAMGLSVTVLS